MQQSVVSLHLEALIFASDKPLSATDMLNYIHTALGFLEEKHTLEQIIAELQAIQEKYQAPIYPFSVQQTGGGYQFLSKPDYYATIALLTEEKHLKKLSSAALETLAIIAYKQPITKGEIESIRGVNSDYSVQRLLEKELIIIMGRADSLPGNPLLYSVSKRFMDYFGINSAADLPQIKETLNTEMVFPSSVPSQIATLNIQS